MEVNNNSDFFERNYRVGFLAYQLVGGGSGSVVAAAAGFAQTALPHVREAIIVACASQPH